MGNNDISAISAALTEAKEVVDSLKLLADPKSGLAVIDDCTFSLSLSFCLSDSLSLSLFRLALTQDGELVCMFSLSLPPSTLQYGYEHFLEQVNLAEQLTSSDFGISTGLINENYWENSKWYYVSVERGNNADKLNGRNINFFH
jgi:hypothetical protein